MNYKNLVDKLAELAEVDPETVRSILYYLPDVLIQIPLNHWVRTPLGTFRMTRRTPYISRNPQGETVSILPQRLIKFKAGKRLREASD